MPELPEVETVARDLRTELVGRRIVSVRVHHPGVLRYPSPAAFSAGLRGTRVVAVERRGKFILCPLDNGDDLVIHLGMTGHVDICTVDQPPRPHTHIVARLDDGRELRFADARRFGRVLLGHRDRLRTLGVLPVLGVEPLGPEFTVARLDAVLGRTTRMLKAALLDQRGVAGLGNIYVDEICHRARVRPARRCHRLTRAQRLALHEAIVAVLTKAIDNRGSSVDDYRDIWDAQGSHQEELQVYGRAGLPCFRDGAILRRTVIAGRTTVYCATCQR
jgi:formamidopyrimidine-DNA glycosylase